MSLMTREQFLYDCCRPEVRSIGAAWILGVIFGCAVFLGWLK
jgi:hypothetical protein